MADIKKIVPKILKWEGGFGFDKADPGGSTMNGITLETFRSFFGADQDVDDLKMMTTGQWMQVLKKMFWDKWQADKIQSQSIAEILVDWVWASGAYGFKEPQKLLGLTPDGIVGPKTLAAINDYPDQAELHQKLYDARMAFIDRIVGYSVNKYKEKNPAATQKDLMEWTFLRFQQGWKNRINDAYKTYQAI
jgi:lysozyme family protein